MASTMAMSRPKVGPRTQPASRARWAGRGGFRSFSVMVIIGRWTTSHRLPGRIQAAQVAWAAWRMNDDPGRRRSAVADCVIGPIGHIFARSDVATLELDQENGLAALNASLFS
jgi:hypothetical protein